MPVTAAAQVTAKTVLRRKIKFRRADQVHDDVVFARDMNPGDPGFVQFVEGWVEQMIAVMPLPNAVTADDAEGSLVDVLKALCATPGPKINPLEVPKTSDPMEWLTELRRVTTTKPAAETHSTTLT